MWFKIHIIYRYTHLQMSYCPCLDSSRKEDPIRGFDRTTVESLHTIFFFHPKRHIFSFSTDDSLSVRAYMQIHVYVIHVYVFTRAYGLQFVLVSARKFTRISATAAFCPPQDAAPPVRRASFYRARRLQSSAFLCLLAA